MTSYKQIINQSLFDKHGLLPVGIYKWPYAACSGKVDKKGNFVNTTNDEAHKICIDFCKKKNKISGNTSGSNIFAKLSNISDSECKKQCDMCKNQIENFEHKKEDTNLIFYYTLLFAFIFVTLIFVKVIS